MKKSKVDRFLSSKVVIELLARELSDDEKAEIDRYFGSKNLRTERDSFRKYVIWLNQGRLDWDNLNLELSHHVRMSEGYFKVLYGEDEGSRRWGECISKLKRNLPNTIDHWVSRGFNEIDAKEQVRLTQSKKSRLKSTLSNRVGSVRCIEYWLKRGFSIDEAKSQVSDTQRRNLLYFKRKYGDEEGYRRYSDACDRRKNAWDRKSLSERQLHSLRTTPATFNPVGQEMQAISMFMEQNSITEKMGTLMFGSPADQFTQLIPGVGYRRYDFAVLKDNAPVIVFEFHGPGHINFSDYDESLCDVPITIGGKQLFNLGTYGSVYRNDVVKKNHIIDTFPDAIYCVAWVSNLKKKDMRIECIRSK